MAWGVLAEDQLVVVVEIDSRGEGGEVCASVWYNYVVYVYTGSSSQGRMACRVLYMYILPY